MCNQSSNEKTCYEDLANTIIEQAAKDYQRYFCLKQGDCDELDEIRQFFRSEYFMSLTKIDPEFLIKKLETECIDMNYNYGHVKTLHKKKLEDCYVQNDISTEFLELLDDLEDIRKKIDESGETKVGKIKCMEINPYIGDLVRRNDGYCICAVVKDEDSKCPCKNFRELELGTCDCGRYFKFDEVGGKHNEANSDLREG